MKIKLNRANVALGPNGLWVLLVLVFCTSAYGQGTAVGYGQSCGILGGPTLTFAGSPEPGGAFVFSANNLHLFDGAFLIVGLSDTTSAYGLLPLNLPGPLFGSGCQLLTSDEFLFPFDLLGSSATIVGSFSPSMDNYRFFAQAILVSPTLWQVSNGLDVFVSAPVAGIGSVAGIVSDLATGTGIPGGRVTLFKSDLSFFKETRSAADGSYAFGSVPSGSYQLGVAKKGCEYQEESIAVVANSQVSEDFFLSAEDNPGSWTVIGTTAPEFLDASDVGVLRPDGSIFYCHDTTDSIVFNPIDGTRIFPQSSGSEQGCMSATHLEDGSILMFGGQNDSSPGSFQNAVSWVKKFRPDNTWEILGNMNAPNGRWYPGLARLNDGRPLVFGGGTAPSAVRTNTSEIFDPATSTWTNTGNMGSANEFAPAALLHNGLVLRTWGSAPELYDPATNQWSATGGLVAPNRGFPGHSDHSLLVLTDQRALILGVDRLNQPMASMTEYFDPSSGTWSAGTSPDLVRFQGEVVYMPDGQIFYGAGDQGAAPGSEPNVLGIVRRCDLLDPVTGSWRRVADMQAFREYHAVTLLIPDGRIVTTGGTRIKFAVGPTTADIEAYSPPYLFRGVRPQISNLSDSTPVRGQTLSVDVFPETALTRFVLMGLQTQNHWIDGGIPRRIELSVAQVGPSAQLTLPTDADLLPAGWYMLFAMVDDIPSEAVILRVDP